MFQQKFLLIFLAIVFAFICADSSEAAEIWVSPSGSDENPGTKEEPMASPSLALRKARELRRLKDPSIADGVSIIFHGGVYRLTSPLFVRPEDSGTETNPTVLKAAENDTPVLSGGLPLSGWEKVEQDLPGLANEATGKIWVTKLPDFQGNPLHFRQLWIGNAKAVRAREPDVGKMERLVAWDRDAEIATIPKSLVGPFVDSSQLEMTILQMWEIANLRVKSLVLDGETAAVKFHQPESKIEFEHPWPQPLMKPKGAPFFLTGAIEFLDQPGEWFFDKRNHQLYYWPREGEDLVGNKAIVPTIETLVQVQGTVDRPVSHIEFHGLQFQHTTWLRPSLKGHVPLQAGMYLTEAYWLEPKGTPEWRSLNNQGWVGRQPSAVSVSGAHHVNFHRCSFEHLAATGLDYMEGTHNDKITGCLFRDIGGNGIQIGGFQEGAIETHLPYNPQDERLISQKELVANNYLTDCANEDWGCVGICAGYVRNVAIEHNEVSDVPYTGISLGWGWTRDENAMRNNVVFANHIHHYATKLSDTAAVYTLSNQPGTIINENYIHDVTMSPYVHDPEHWFYLYLDEGSSNISVKDNWCPAEKFLANSNGPGNVWENNGPEVDKAIQENAGLEPEFRDLLSQ